MWKDLFPLLFEISLPKNCFQLLFLIHVQRAFAWSCLLNPVSKKQIQSLLTVSPRIHIKFPYVVIQNSKPFTNSSQLTFAVYTQTRKMKKSFASTKVVCLLDPQNTSPSLTVYLCWCHFFHLRWPLSSSVLFTIFFFILHFNLYFL